MICTQSLARMVGPLSTEVLADHSVTLNAAFFSGWRFPRHTLLFVHLSSASLASCSTPLRVYVFYPNNHFRLASFREPYSLTCKVLSTFHNVPEQSFAFMCYKLGVEPRSTVYKTVVLPLDNLRTYQDVLLQLLHALLDTKYHTPHVFRLADY